MRPRLQHLRVATDTPAGVVNAINAANTGVKATLMDTGTDGNNLQDNIIADKQVAMVSLPSHQLLTLVFMTLQITCSRHKIQLSIMKV